MTAARLLVALLALLPVLAACSSGSDGEGPTGLLADDPPRTDPPARPNVPVVAPDPQALARRLAAGFAESHGDPVVGYGLRYPSGWRSVGIPRRGLPAILQGPEGSSCTAAATGRLPDWTRRANRIAYLERRVGTRAVGDAGPVESFRGANTEGVTVTYASGPTRTSTALFASAGAGVAVSCVAPRTSFARLEREVFRPLFTTVRVRRDPALERAQPRITGVPGVAGAGLSRQGGAIAAGVYLYRDPGSSRVARAVLRELARLFPGRRVSVNAAKDPVRPVLGAWNPGRESGYVQEIDKETVRFERP